MSSLESVFNEALTSIRDLPDAAIQRAMDGGVVAWDIETSGLDWRTDYIGTCQIYLPEQDAYVIQVKGETPKNLKTLLTDPTVVKIFHHAMFDLRFMAHRWSAMPQNVVCTKVASKILDPAEHDHSLSALVQRYLGIILDKKLRRSNWLKANLSRAQVNYAVKDVIYLPILFQLLRTELLERKKWYLATSTFDYMPARVQLDILGFGDLFQY